jgi:hypothetical protein
MNLTPDSVCRTYADKKIKLTLRTLENDEDTILIEGEPEALEFLGQLLLAQAVSKDCGFQLGPTGAGRTLFSKESTKGMYIHCLPCGHATAGP